MHSICVRSCCNWRASTVDFKPKQKTKQACEEGRVGARSGPEHRHSLPLHARNGCCHPTWHCRRTPGCSFGCDQAGRPRPFSTGIVAGQTAVQGGADQCRAAPAASSRAHLPDNKTRSSCPTTSHWLRMIVSTSCTALRAQHDS